MDDVFHDPQNPYTEGLLRSMPKLGEKIERLAVIPGVVPSPLNWPSGCRFQDRCPYGWEKTEKEECGGLWRMLYVCTCIDVNHLSISLVQAYKTQP